MRGKTIEQISILSLIFYRTIVQKNKKMEKEKEKALKVVLKIMAFRKKRGFTYENMAAELTITPAA